MQKLRYASYIRVSDQRQLDGYSPDAQRSAIAKYISQNNGILVHEYFDGGISGTSTNNRDEFNQMRVDAKRGLFDVLIVHKFDRLARSRIDAATTKLMLRKDCKIKIISAIGEPSADTDPIMGTLIEGIMETLAEWYSVNLGNEVRKGRLEMLSQGKWYGASPYGYKRNPDTATLEIVESEAAIVRRIFETYAQGNLGIQRIAYMLTADGLKTRAYDKKGGREWTKGTLQSLLKNRTYIGEMPYQAFVKGSDGRRVTSRKNRTWSQGTHEPIISLELFERCEAIMKANEKVVTHATEGSEYLLDGITYCLDCMNVENLPEHGGRMQGRRKRSNNKKNVFTYYYCRNEGATHGHVRADRLEQEVIEFLCDGGLIEDWEGKYLTIAEIAQDTDAEAVQNRIKQLKDVLNRKIRRWDEGLFLGSEDDFKAEFEAIQREINALEFQVVDGYEYAKALLADFGSFWAEATTAEAQRKLLRQVVHKVIVRRGKLAGIVIKPSYIVILPPGGNSDDDYGLGSTTSEKLLKKHPDLHFNQAQSTEHDRQSLQQLP